MGLNSPLPGTCRSPPSAASRKRVADKAVRLQDETRKAAKILRSFCDSKNNGLDKVIPHSILEKAAGFAIFTVVKAGFLFSARAGSGIVIARTSDGSWSPPSAIGIGGFGFGGQAGAEVTDFLIVLNSRSAVTTFMSAGSLTLGGNLSVAVGPLGRNAEGSGAVNSKGKMAAMYSYSKTKGLFGGVSVEGTVIVERQDANRMAYGGSVSVKEILSGTFDPPDWSQVLIDQIETSTGLPYGRKWVPADEDDIYGQGYGENGDGGSGTGTRSRGSSVGQGYAFGDGIGGSGSNSPGGHLASERDGGRRRAGSLLGPNADKDRDRDRPSSKRTSSFNPFGGSGSNTPKKNPILSSSESYNAGLTWDSDGPLSPYAPRPRSNTNPNRSRAGSGASARAFDEGEIWNTSNSLSKMAITNGSRSRAGSNPPARYDDTSLGSGSRSRSGSNPPNKVFDDVPERYDDDAFASPSPLAPVVTPSAARDPFDDFSPSASNGNGRNGTSSPLRNGSGSGHKPNIPLKAGLEKQDGYARAVGLYTFTATDTGDLGFEKGQVITIIGKAGGDWWKGRDNAGKEGIFPSNYVEVVELPKDPKGGIPRYELKARTPGLDFD